MNDVMITLRVEAATWEAQLTRHFRWPFCPHPGMNIRIDDGDLITVGPEYIEYDLAAGQWTVVLTDGRHRDIAADDADAAMSLLVGCGWTLEHIHKDGQDRF